MMTAARFGRRRFFYWLLTTVYCLLLPATMSLQTRSKVFGGHMTPNDGGVDGTARDGFRDECGVFGIYGHDDAARLAYLGLYQLQHRGQESCGIVANDGAVLRSERAMGLVSEVFDEERLNRLPGVSA